MGGKKKSNQPMLTACHNPKRVYTPEVSMHKITIHPWHGDMGNGAVISFADHYEEPLKFKDGKMDFEFSGDEFVEFTRACMGICLEEGFAVL